MYNDVSAMVSRERMEYLKRLRIRHIVIKSVQIGLLVGFFILWEAAARLRLIDPFIFSQPTRMAAALADMVKSGMIWTHVGITLYETIVGFVLGTILGTAAAVVLWWNEFVSEVCEPYLVVLNSLPKTALAPIIIVWLGNNMTSIIATALMTSVIVTILSVLNGFLHVDEDKIKLIKTFGGTKLQVLRKVVLPACVPDIISALKINVGLSFVGVIVGEFLVSKAGLGYLIVYGGQVFKLDWVMLSVIILAVMASILYQLIVLLEKRFFKWRE